ncbi:MAG: MCE family protein [Lentisphaeria bacterium]|nr:MCE family protein [Lentisphaeria bacterium]
MQENNYFKLGLFVVVAFFLFFAGLICLGVMDQFKSKAYLMTQVSESVHGLSRGSSVRFQGVPIGKVTNITIDAGTCLVQIIMEINLDNFRAAATGPDVGDLPVTDDDLYARLNKEIPEEGLRCRIEGEGITGMKYIEFFYETEPQPLKKEDYGFAQHRTYYVPSLPSLMSDLRTSVVSILDKLDSVDYKGISNRINVTLDSADRFLNDPKIEGILAHLNTATDEITKTITTLNKTLTEERVSQLLEDSGRTVNSIGELSRKLDEEISGADIDETARKVRFTLDSLRSTSDKFIQTMNKLDGGIDAAVELIQTLDHDPASLIRGKVQTEELR